MNKNAAVTVITCLVVFVVGFGLGRVTSGVSPDISSVQSGANVLQPQDGSQPETEGGTTVDASSLTPGQRSMIESMGIDPDSITITPAMIACAEAKLGAARIEEIKNGATPSFTEGATLIACYR